MTVTVDRNPRDVAILSVALRLRDVDRREIAAVTDLTGDDLAFFASAQACAAPLRAVIAFDEQPVAVIAAGENWPGNWWVAAWSTDEWPRVMMASTRLLRRSLPAVWALGGHRLECRAAAWRCDVHRWIESCGGLHESTLRAWGRSGEDYLIYRWIKEN